jgi:hypothetical protein
MNTRSQTKYTNSAKYAVEIDFDGASTAWKANKKPTCNGCYKYICSHKTKAGKECKRESPIGCDLCKIHNNSK